MTNSEYDGEELDFEPGSEQAPDTGTPLESESDESRLEAGADHDKEREMRRRDQMRALEEEAIEAEHIDNFLAGGSSDAF